MAVIEHPETEERREFDGEIPFHLIYSVSGYDEDADEWWDEDRIDLAGESWIVVDNGVDMIEIDSNS